MPGSGAGGREAPDGVMNIGSSHVMHYAADALSVLARRREVVLRAMGGAIPSAVAVANIITEKAGTGSSLGGIRLDTEDEPGIGRMTSTIEITITRP